MKNNTKKVDFQRKESIAKKNLEDLCYLLNKVGVKYWLTSGTLLGCISRNSILPNDRDIDLGAWESEREKINKIIPLLRKKGFNVIKQYNPAHGKLKGMITLVRGEFFPIDIKLYEEYDNYVARSILKSKGFKTKLLVRIIEMLYFKKEYSLPKMKRPSVLYYLSKILYKLSVIQTQKVPEKKLKRVSISYYFYKVLYKITLTLPHKTSEKLIIYLSQLLRKTNIVYGMEVLPKRYFEKFISVNFYGMKFNVFENYEEYLNEEYGMNWSEHNPSGKGGLEKYSHIVYSKDLVYDIKNDDELLRRCKAIGYIK